MTMLNLAKIPEKIYTAELGIYLFRENQDFFDLI